MLPPLGGGGLGSHLKRGTRYCHEQDRATANCRAERFVASSSTVEYHGGIPRAFIPIHERALVLSATKLRVVNTPSLPSYSYIPS